MHCTRKIIDDLYFIGANDKRLALFENVHPLEDGVSYNSYLLCDDKTVLLDTVDWSVGEQFFENLDFILNGRNLDYVIVNHMEPDHAATLGEVVLRYPDVQVISNEKAFAMMEQFGFNINNRLVVKEGDTMNFGKHELTFVFAPMVHWPEAMVTYDTTTGTLFSADAFGSFKSLDGKLFADEVNFDRDFIDEARRYYTNIVGKYGSQVMTLLKKAEGLDIKMICPLHGLIWRKDIPYILDKQVKWASYEPEEKGVLIAYASMYGHTEAAAHILANQLCQKGVTNIRMYDVSKTHPSYIISDAFKLSHMALLSVTYNNEIYPCMETLLLEMKHLALQNRKVSVVENGTWAPQAGRLMLAKLEEMKNMEIIGEKVTIKSAVNEDANANLEKLADAIVASM